MSKPNIKEVLEIARMKKAATSLYDEIDRRVAAMAEQFGSGRFDYDLVEFLNELSEEDDFDFGERFLESGRYYKLEITDNVKMLQSGKSVGKSSRVTPGARRTQPLKRCPASLK